MPFPVFRHHDSTKVGMATEVNSEEVEDFALVEVGRGPYRGNAVEGGSVTIESNDETNPLLQLVRKNTVRDLKAGLGGEPVDRGDILKKVIASLLNCFRCRDDVLASHGNGKFASVVLGVRSEVGEGLYGRVLRMRLEDGLFAFDGRGGIVH